MRITFDVVLSEYDSNIRAITLAIKHAVKSLVMGDTVELIMKNISGEHRASVVVDRLGKDYLCSSRHGEEFPKHVVVLSIDEVAIELKKMKKIDSRSL
jgi:hypothetical protein